MTPTVFFDYYKEQNGMNNEDMKGFDLITGILAGGSFALLLNLCCLQQRGIIVSFRKSWREVCCSRMTPVKNNSIIGATVPVEPVASDIGIKIHKNPNKYYIPKSNGIRQVSHVANETKRVRYTMPPRIAPNSSNPIKINMKRSYMKRDFPPIRDHSEQV